jgi:hypothetical protein
VALHADLTMRARLSQALAWTRAVPLPSLSSSPHFTTEESRRPSAATDLCDPHALLSF